MDRTAAVKLLPTTLNKNPADVKRFLREMKAAAQLEHPNIVQTYDAGCANGRYFLAMECVEGKTLDRTVKERGPLPVSLAVDFVLQAARGLAYAHQRGIIHRDIKPSNLILGPRNRVQILDMGLARIVSDGQGKSINLSGTDTSMGTADFMAPEQALELKHADARSDVYSLGCTLYFLIRGDVMWSEVAGHDPAHVAPEGAGPLAVRRPQRRAVGPRCRLPPPARQATRRSLSEDDRSGGRVAAPAWRRITPPTRRCCRTRRRPKCRGRRQRCASPSPSAGACPGSRWASSRSCR